MEKIRRRIVIELENKRFTTMWIPESVFSRFWIARDNGKQLNANDVVELLNNLYEENQELKHEKEYFEELLDKHCIETNDFDKFMNTGTHVRLSINLETDELQRHIYATGNWFGDFDRVLVKDWLDDETYQKFIDRVIEVYNTEFKKEIRYDE